MTTWAVILAVGAGSFMFRIGPLLLLQTRALSEMTDRVIRYAGLAAISGLIGMAVDREAHGTSMAPTFVAIAVGGALAARRTSILGIILAGGGLYALTLVIVEVLAQ